ncbi:hypothetical protein K439DRAFT_1617434 [Ramaria rubella]|nr:hypothetical protein K439DRAFT_1617434 [Ramaria rubella]
MSRPVQPPSTSLTLHGLLTLPMRICNPPPAASRVRSCKVTPLIKITLDDVLNKRHLPPLTLKDFEEWLVFVEGIPQYLYFILWLKEYESRYAAWLSESGCSVPTSSPTLAKSPSISTLSDADTPPRNPDLSYINLIPSSPPLALFFTRAKQTFLDPASSSPYALGPAALRALAPSTHSLTPSIPTFTIPIPGPDAPSTIGTLPPALATQPHPHPRELAPLATYARTVLKESLDRFAESACHNVGTRRAWCGIAGGTFITLVFGLLPSLATLFFAPCRWWRAVGWFGCWLGGTIVVSSFHGVSLLPHHSFLLHITGYMRLNHAYMRPISIPLFSPYLPTLTPPQICMMIYVFGDLRQLRSFELARPPISPPRAIARARPRHKSFFTRDGEHAHECTTDEKMHSESRSKSKSSPLLTHVVSTTPSQEHKRTTALSCTSTGTPVVHLGRIAFQCGVDSEGTTTDSDITGLDSNSANNNTKKSSAGVGGLRVDVDLDLEAAAGEGDEADDFGIEISPAYYYPEKESEGTSGESGDRTGSGGTIGSKSGNGIKRVGSPMSLVMQWMLGRRGSVSLGAATGENGNGGWKARSQTQGTLGVRSHAGTFGVRSWRARGGLGSLIRSGGGGEGIHVGSAVGGEKCREGVLDIKKGGVGVGSENEDEKEKVGCHGNGAGLGDDGDEEVEMELGRDILDVLDSEDMDTAAFIPHDYPVPAPVPPITPIPAPSTLPNPTPTAPKKSKRVSFPVSFDFDKLPAVAAAARRKSTGSGVVESQTERDHGRAGAPLPFIPPWHVPASTSAPLSVPIPTPQPAPHTHTPSSDLAHPRQWWDTCPRHPTVEAHLTSTTPLPSSTRATSPTSSDIHSRACSPMPCAFAVPHAPSHPYVHAPPNTPHFTAHPHTRPNTSTWRTRFRTVTAVPAFGPLTRVLEPVVSRGQWEIVVRSALVAALGAWIVVGALVALPEVR